jgi:hypothetical protein
MFWAAPTNPLKVGTAQGEKGKYKNIDYNLPISSTIFGITS